MHVSMYVEMVYWKWLQTAYGSRIKFIVITRLIRRNLLLFYDLKAISLALSRLEDEDKMFVLLSHFTFICYLLNGRFLHSFENGKKSGVELNVKWVKSFLSIGEPKKQKIIN